MYKNESDVPEPLQRKLNGLAGLFETADDQFQHIYDARQGYLEGVRLLTGTPSQFLETSLNVDSLTEYLRWKFPKLQTEPGDDIVGNINAAIDHRRFRTLKHVDDAFNSTREMRNQIRKEVGKHWEHKEGLPATAELVWAIGCVDKNFRDNEKMHADTKTAIESAIAE